MSDYFYIYNLRQSMYFIASGLPLLDIGVGAHRDVFHKFARNEESERVFEEWNKNKPTGYEGPDLNDRCNNSSV